MRHRTAAYFVDVDTDDAQILECAKAARIQNGHLKCVLIAALPNLPYLKYKSNRFVEEGLPSNWLDAMKAKGAALNIRATEVETLLERQGVSAEVIAFMGSGTDLQHLVAQQANCSDIAFLDAKLRKEPDVFHKIACGLLFHSTVALMINGDPYAERNRLFLAWNDSLPAYRAAHLALPYFLAAKNVVVGCFEPPSRVDEKDQESAASIEKWLSHHGCNVSLLQFVSSGLSIEQCIQERAKEIGADLVVMGAYGHSYFRESVFGGTTQAMLDQTKIPVLLGH